MLVRKGGGASGPDTNTGNLVATGTAQITGDSGFGTAPVSAAKITLNQGNVTNKQALTLTNLGAGSSGIRMEPASGGSFQLGPVMGNDFQIAAINRTVSMQVNNSAYDGAAAQSFLMQHTSRAAATLLVLKAQDVGQTGDILQLQKSTGGVLAKVSATGKLTLIAGEITSETVNGSTAKGFTFNTPAYTTTAKIASFANNSVEKAYIQQDGNIYAAGYYVAGTAQFGTTTNDSVRLLVGGVSRFFVSDTQVRLPSDGVIFSSTTDTNGPFDAGIKRKAAKITEINDGTAGSYAGTAFCTGSQTIAQLPAAATAGAGARAFVTDANSTTFLSVVASGGANKVPVVSDGTNWLIG